MIAPRLEAALRAWPSALGAGATVALLDSGVETAHPDLAGADIESVALEWDGRCIAPRTCQGEDSAGHGTACANRILVLAPKVRILSCRVLSHSMKATSQALLGALEWLLTREDIDVVNLSIGTPSRSHGLDIAHCVDRFYARGIPVVASAGPEERPDYPAVFASPVSVAEIACQSDDYLAFRAGELVEFAARGVGVDVAWAGGERVRVSGSSFAAPLVSARIARLKAAEPRLRVWEIKTLLQIQAEAGLARETKAGHATGRSPSEAACEGSAD